MTHDDADADADADADDGAARVAVLGVDGCRAGWVGVLLGAGAQAPGVLVADRIGALVEAVLARSAERGESLAAVAVDIPIGLPDAGPRRADVEARRRLTGGRKSSVFPTPVRTSVESLSWAEANAANRAATGGVGISKQAWHLFDRVLDVDEHVRGGAPVPVFEVHPEVVFARLAGGSIAAGKRTAGGRAARERVLRDAGLVPPAPERGAGYAVDDLLDACACALTARRIVAGEAESLPDPPERFSDGLPAAIWV